MTRHDGTLVDAERRMVRDRSGCWHPAEKLRVAGSGLFYGRAWADDRILAYSETWLLPGPGWVVHRFVFQPGAPFKPDWYIEIDPVEVRGPLWHQRDGYLDVSLYEGQRYELEDAGELAEGMDAGHITAEEVAAALTSLDSLCSALRRLGCSGAALLAEFAPDLPR